MSEAWNNIYTTMSIVKLEKDIQREICEWLKENNYFFWRSNNIPVFGRNNAGKMTFRSQGKYTPKGIPDILILDMGIFIGIEVKRELNYKISDDQLLFGEKMQKNGGKYFIVHSLDEVKSIME